MEIASDSQALGIGVRVQLLGGSATGRGMETSGALVPGRTTGGRNKCHPRRGNRDGVAQGAFVLVAAAFEASPLDQDHAS